jgi:chemotaxis protein MotB
MSGPHKKGGHEEGGGHAPMWIVSFADMVILLMSFFVLLLCQSSQKTSTDADLIKILASVKASFGYAPKADSKDPLDIAVLQILSQKQKGGFTSNGQRLMQPSIKGQQTKDRDTWVKAQANVGKPVRFSRSSAVIPKSADGDLNEIAEVVRHHFRAIIVQGHCSQEESAHDSLEGHDLSFRRALAVKVALEARGVAASRLRIVSCGAHESLSEIKSPDRQLVVVTLGAYFLPSASETPEEGSKTPTAEAPSSSHSKH